MKYLFWALNLELISLTNNLFTYQNQIKLHFLQELKLTRTKSSVIVSSSFELKGAMMYLS